MRPITQGSPFSGSWYVSFTLIERISALTVVGLLKSIPEPRYLNSIDKSKEVLLRKHPVQPREALDEYYGDNGKRPNSLAILVEKQYPQSIYFGPMTDKISSRIICGEYNVQSGAEGEASDGSAHKRS